MLKASTTNSMQAAVLHGREDVRIEQVAIPEPAAGEVILRVAAALTCGTDLKVYRRGYHAKMLMPPILFGHEVAGVVHALGQGVEQFHLGDRVVALNSAPCDACYFCMRGQQNLCDDLLFNNGAYAEYIRIPARIVAKNMLAVPATLPLEQAALTEPLACVVLGLEETAARAGDEVVVFGTGPIGLLFIHLSALQGMRVIAIVKRASQAETAHRFGAADTILISDYGDSTSLIGAVRARTRNGHGADVVIEAVATPATWEQSVLMARKGGIVNFFGGCEKGTTVALDTNLLHYSSISLRATFHHTPRTCRQAFELISSGRFRAADFISARAPLADVPAVFAAMLDRGASQQPPPIKTAIIP